MSHDRGSATRSEIPVFRPDITQEEIDAVVATLRSGWLGAGPRAARLEEQFAAAMSTRFATATSSGTAALQCALAALEVHAGDEIILPSFTWVSAFQVIRALGATPVFADIEPAHLTLDPESVRASITPRTKGVIVVHHGGQLADLDALGRVTREHGLWLLDDAAHACGARYRGQPVGGLTDITCFSFNAMKNMATGDGGMVTTRDEDRAQRARLFRSLGIDRDTYVRYAKPNEDAPWLYDVVSEGLRLHMNDIAAALGLVQLSRLTTMNAARARVACRYAEGLADIPGVTIIGARPDTSPSHHMCTMRVPARDAFVAAMRSRGISVGVHYIPVHLFSAAKPWHRSLPVTEAIWSEVVTLPMFPSMTDDDQTRVIDAIHEVLGHT